MKPRILFCIVCAMLLIPTSVTPKPNVRCFIPIVDFKERLAYELKSATAVFSGKVISEEYRPLKNSTEHPNGSEELVVKILVARWWKGDSREEMEMYTGMIKNPNGMIWSYAEDFHFEMGKHYLVFAFGQPERLTTDACKLTQEFEQATEQLRLLGEGDPPKKQS